MSGPIPLETRPFGFVPATSYATEQLEKYPIGARVWATITKSRSAKMNAFYWALVSYVAKGIGLDKEALSDELLIRTGRIDTLTFYADSAVKTQPKRISKMDHASFSSYLDEAIELILKDYLGQIRRADLLRVVERMAGVSYSEAKAEKEKE